MLKYPSRVGQTDRLTTTAYTALAHTTQQLQKHSTSIHIAVQKPSKYNTSNTTRTLAAVDSTATSAVRILIRDCGVEGDSAKHVTIELYKKKNHSGTYRRTKDTHTCHTQMHAKVPVASRTDRQAHDDSIYRASTHNSADTNIQYGYT